MNATSVFTFSWRQPFVLRKIAYDLLMLLLFISPHNISSSTKQADINEILNY